MAQKKIATGTAIGGGKVKLENGQVKHWGGAAGALHATAFFRYEDDTLFCYGSTEEEYTERKRYERDQQQLFLITTMQELNLAITNMHLAGSKWRAELYPEIAPELAKMQDALKNIHQTLTKDATTTTQPGA